MKYYLAFDIGGTNIKFGVLDDNANILEKGKVSTTACGESIIANIVKIKEKYGALYDLKGVAFSMPGFVNVDSGYLQTAGAIDDFYGINFKQMIAEKLSLPVELENDVNCVALAEKWRGNAQDTANFICITIGTGIGGAICINNQLCRGHNYMAGEFGFMMLDNVFTSNDKQNASMSFCASVKEGLRRRYCDAEGILDIDEISGEDIYRLAENGNETAKSVIEHFYQSIALGLYNLTFILNPQKIIIGGAISERYEIFPEIKRKFQEIIDSQNAIQQFTVNDFVSIESSRFNNDSGIIGAVYHYLTMTESRHS
ncbi:ROK family protein [Psychromonas ossibalaenae]|uniref:ROK family protein n=1 Tax=Psychromonas ossibalaenae TaxID=444922 RepID=UPI000363D9DA|nr:ROK family protein [Psychromonas ossibalaenae]